MKYVMRCLAYLRPYRQLALLSTVLLLLSTAFGLLGPWPLKVLVDHVLQDQPVPDRLAALLGTLADDRISLLLIVVGAGLLITLIDNALKVLSSYVNTRIEQYMVLDVRSDLFRRTEEMSFAFHDKRRTGKVIHTLNSQGGAVPAIIMAGQHIAQNALMLGGMLWIVWHLDPYLALLSLVVVPCLYFSIGYYAKGVLPRLRRVRNMEVTSLTIVHEALSMLRVILAFGREDHEYRRFREHGRKTVAARVNVTVRETLFNLSVNMSTALGTALVLGFGAFRALQGTLTVGELLVVLTYVAAVYKPLESISFTISSLQQKAVALEHVFGLLDMEPQIRDAPGALSIPHASGRVTFEHVHFSYEGREGTLNDISFEAAPGALIGVVGPTGAGKTTLVSLIPRFYEPAAGRVLLDGRDIRTLTLESLRRQISVVLQEPLLFSGTIADNIRYGRLDATMDEIVKAAKNANAHDFIRRLPRKYRTQLGERGAQLSGGERQRICIARAFLKDAPILILDEPTSAIDSRTESVILDALERLVVGRTTFMIAHRLSTVRHADMLLVLSSGEVVQRGSHADLIAEPGLYRQLCDLQSRQGSRRQRQVIGRVETTVPELLA